MFLCIYICADTGEYVYSKKIINDWQTDFDSKNRCSTQIHYYWERLVFMNSIQ